MDSIMGGHYNLLYILIPLTKSQLSNFFCYLMKYTQKKQPRNSNMLQ